MVKIALIVLNWNKPNLTIDTVNSLLNITHHGFDFQIFIVDNGSFDDSITLFNEKFSHQPLVNILQVGSNQGFVGGNNFGIRQSLKLGFDYVLLINNDVSVDPDFLSHLLKATKDKYSLSAPKIYFSPGCEYHHDRYSPSEIGHVIWFAGGQMDWHNIYGSHIGVDEVDHGQYDHINSQVDFLTGCCLLIHKDVFAQIGLLDEKYYMYLEDADFCQKAKKKGFKMAYIPQSKIWHINAASSKSGGDLHNYFLTRNRLLFGFRYATLKTKLALIKESITQLISPSISKWQKNGVIDFYLKKLKKGSWQ